MNAIIDPPSALPGGTEQIGRNDTAGAGPIVHTLSRTGHKAVRFEGQQLIEAIGGAEGRQCWHDLNLYRTVAGSIVVELIVRNEPGDRHDLSRHDLSRVEAFKDLASAADWLEAYRPANDVTIPAGLGEIDSPLPWAVLQAVQLRQRIELIELDYRSLLSDVFAAIDLTDTPEEMPTGALA